MGQLVSPLLGIAFSRCILMKNASYWGLSQPRYSNEANTLGTGPLKISLHVSKTSCLDVPTLDL